MNDAQILVVQSFIESLPTPVTSLAKGIYEKLIATDSKGEISQLSNYFLKSLVPINKGQLVDQSSVDNLGAANFFIWMAYSLYDGALDQDLPLNVIPVANILERKGFELYRQSTIYLDAVLGLLNQTDQANAWELSFCRFSPPKFKVTVHSIPSLAELETLLAARSVAHIAGPVLLFASYTSDIKRQQTLLEALMLYCTSRQLNDDLHDWVDDFTKGRITYVVAYLLNLVEYKPHEAIQTDILLQKMKRAFYETGIEEVCATIENNIILAIKKLSQCNIPKSSSFIRRFLSPILYSARQAKQSHKQNKEFVEHYANK